MNQIQNWFINARKRFLGPLKSEIEKDDISGNRDTSVHQSLPVKSSIPFTGIPPNMHMIIPQKITPPVFPFPVQYDQKDPTVALNLPEENGKEKKKIDLEKVNQMIMQMNQLQAMWIQSNPIFSYYNQAMMQQQMNRNRMVAGNMMGGGQFQNFRPYPRNSKDDRNPELFTLKGDNGYQGNDDYKNV